MNQNNYQGGQQPPYGQQQGYGQQPPYGQQPYQPYYRPYCETTTNNAFNPGPEGKCRGVYAILALFGGSIGLHYFYINKVGAAILTIVLVLVTCGAFAIIPVIQGILALWTLSNEDFDRRFVSSPNFWPFF